MNNKSQNIDRKVEEIEGRARNLSGWQLQLVAIIAFSWSLFQLWYASPLPYIVGFGIANRSDVISVNEISHGAVIGSAIIKEMKKNSDPVAFIKNYIEKLNS